MYNKDKVILSLTLVLVAIIAWLFKLEYKNIASESITAVSIAIAVHLSAVTMLRGSKIASIMRKPDIYIDTKTQLGVFVTYVKWAVAAGISSIAASCAVLVVSNKPSDSNTLIYKVFSTLGFSLFAATVLFMWIIFQFMAQALLNEARS